MPGMEVYSNKCDDRCMYYEGIKLKQIPMKKCSQSSRLMWFKSIGASEEFIEKEFAPYPDCIYMKLMESDSNG